MSTDERKFFTVIGATAGFNWAIMFPPTPAAPATDILTQIEPAPVSPAAPLGVARRKELADACESVDKTATNNTRVVIRVRGILSKSNKIEKRARKILIKMFLNDFLQYKIIDYDSHIMHFNTTWYHK